MRKIKSVAQKLREQIDFQFIKENIFERDFAYKLKKNSGEISIYCETDKKIGQFWSILR
jgi:hypothetical protein